MADTVTLSRRSQRTAAIRRRATAAGLGVLAGAFVLVGVTTSSPASPASSTSAASDAPVVSADSRLRPAAPAAAAPRRIKTRQS